MIGRPLFSKGPLMLFVLPTNEKRFLMKTATQKKPVEKENNTFCVVF
jgi:hypothetical protein